MLKPPRRISHPGKETREIRIFSGEPHNVITLDGTIIKDLGPIKRAQKIEEKEDIKLQVVSEDEVAGKNQISDTSTTKAEPPKYENFPPDNCPQCKSKNIEPSLYLENSIRYKCNDCSETFVAQKPVEDSKVEKSSKVENPNTVVTAKVEELPKVETPNVVEELPKAVEELPKAVEEIPKVEELPKVETPKVDIPKVEELPKGELPKLDVTPKVEELPKVETPKVDVPKIVPKVDIPKVETPKVDKVETQKVTKKVDIPKVIPPKVDNKKVVPATESKQVEDKMQVKKPKVETINVQTPKIKFDIEDMLDLKEVKYMADENAEKQVEEILKKREFQKNIEDAANFALESKDRIENISKEIDDIEGQIGTVSKSVGELCTGVDCIKNDIKKYQEVAPALEKQINEKNAGLEKQINEKNAGLEKQIETKFDEITKRIQKLEQPTFVCDNCGDPSIRPLSSFCSNCGSPIHNWTDENGMPIRGWSPYWKRMGKIDSSGQEIQ